VVLPPHENAKHQSTPHHRTQSSTLNKPKQATGKPKVVVTEVHDEAGCNECQQIALQS